MSTNFAYLSTVHESDWRVTTLSLQGIAKKWFTLLTDECNIYEYFKTEIFEISPNLIWGPNLGLQIYNITKATNGLIDLDLELIY